MCGAVVREDPGTLGLVPDHLKTQEMFIEAVRIELFLLAYVTDCFKTQEICKETVRNMPCMLLFVPDHLRTQEMCNEIMYTMPKAFHRIPDHLKIQEMHKKAVGVGCSSLWLVLDHFKMQEICDKTVTDDSSSLQFVPDWLVTREGVHMWYDDYYDGDGDRWVTGGDDNFLEWYDGCKKRKAQKAQIKKKLMPIAWHPSKWWNWYVPEDKKKETEKLWAQTWTFLYLVTRYKNFFDQKELQIRCLL